MEHDAGGKGKGGRKAWLWMIACCAPFIALIALGYCGVRP